ncbi:MAG: ATP-binding protein [Agathobacter sp.]
MNYIDREIEDIVQHSAKTFKAILVTGARQTGKSTLLRHLFPEIKEVSFDDSFVEEQAKNNPDMFMMLNEPPVFLDKIQYVPSLFRYIKMSCDNHDEKGLYYLSGSQPFKLMDMVSDSLAGRVAIIEITPLSLREIMKSSCKVPFLPTMGYIKERGGEAKKPDNIWKIIHRGGSPEMQNPDVDWGLYIF